MPDRWDSVFVRVSTPLGMVDMGMTYQRKNRKSNIICLVCAEQKELHTSETLLKFARHIRKEHPQIARMALVRNCDRIIV